MKSFEIGQGLTCDLEKLVVSRLLVQANSGGGKSWLLRRLLEQTAGQIQHLVIDPEGEFSTLREKFDYVLAAKTGGDTAADPRTAKLLAERLLELRVSAILDIYELDPHARVLFVRRFLEGIIDAPKTLWHPALVVVDEAHVYCPEVGQAESANAVKALATRGRKRGFCAVFATQRLSKFSKDAAAECNNKLIGRTSLDVDMQRAGDELGMSKANRGTLRDLDAGEFFAFGPALTFDADIKGTGVQRIHVGPVQTRHPEAGGRLALSAPPPTAHVKALLSKLSDLPAEAEQRERTVEDLKREVATLKRQISSSYLPQVETKVVEKFVLKDGQLGRACAIVSHLEQLAEKASEYENDLRVTAKEIRDAIAQTRTPIPTPTPVKVAVEQPRLVPEMHTQGRRVAPAPATSRPASLVSANGDGVKLGGGERKILAALAQYPDGRTKKQLGILCVYSTKGGRFNNILGALRSAGYIEGKDTVRITDTGLAALGEWTPLPQGAELLEYWRQQLQPSEAKVLDVIADAHPRALTKEQVAAATEPPYEPSGGRFNNILGKLRTLGLIEGRGDIRASEDLF